MLFPAPDFSSLYRGGQYKSSKKTKATVPYVTMKVLSHQKEEKGPYFCTYFGASIHQIAAKEFCCGSLRYVYNTTSESEHNISRL
mmetsp:Transcript_38056/g.63182  ORF Transcript_38056/g.63182 Transcript_38056/m.63182 type:complete len:85 (+) Transcript_38056:260-514(+)